MFGSLGAPELIIIGVIVILLFGVGKLSGLGKDLGSSVKEFRKAVKDEEKPEPQQTQVYIPPAQPTQQYTPPQQPQYQAPPPPAAPTGEGSKEKPNVF